MPVSSRRIKQGAKLLNPGKVGKQRGCSKSTTGDHVRKSIAGESNCSPSSKGRHRQVNNRDYIQVTARKTRQEGAAPARPEAGRVQAVLDRKYRSMRTPKTIQGGKTPARPTSGRAHAVTDKDYFPVTAARNKRGAQVLKEAKLGKKHTLTVKYSNVSSNKGTRVSVPFEEAKHGRSAIQEAIHTSATAGVHRPNAQPLRDNTQHTLDRSIPRYEASAGRISTAFRKDHEVLRVSPLERKLPISQASTNAGHAGLGTDTYANQARGAKIRPTLRTNSGFEGRATVPTLESDRRAPTLRSEGRNTLMKRAHLASQGRN